MQDQNTNADKSAIAAPTVGDLLKQVRESKGLTRETVAEHLNLLVSQVAALEANDFDRFPGVTFVRGHLRSYARLLNIDVSEVLALHGEAAPITTTVLPQEGQFKWRPMSLEQKPNRWRRYSGLAATVLLLVGLWAWQEHRDKASLLSLTADNGAATDLAGGIDSALSSASENALFDSVQLLPNNDAKSSAKTASATNDNAAKSENPAATMAEVDKLSLRFSADCWIEIKDRDNRLIVATLKHADEKLQIEGRGPFKVLLGYAPGVSMAYNGTPVKVDVSEGSRSTRLIVGNG